MHDTSASNSRLHELLHQFGHDSFRPGQKECIQALLDGRDVLGVLPTSGGKSLIYQLTAQLLPCVTVVVSPLIALMQDQLESLEDQGIDAGAINSTRSERELSRDISELRRGDAKILYVTPERFGDPSAVALLEELDVSLFVVDEAHCITEWGHDFRPAYLDLHDVVRSLGRPPVLALTATATPVVRAEIIERLGLRDPFIQVHGTDRPNLYFEVRRVESAAQKWQQLGNLFGDDSIESSTPELAACMTGPGIVYTATTRTAREVAEWLQERGVSAEYYHGQRRAADRERVQEAFMNGDVRVVAATNAFGLGVDKPDVRFVVHLEPPASIEEYYQEAGRAGRDGELARCVLLSRDADLSRARFHGASGHVEIEYLEKIRTALKSGGAQSREQLRRATGLSRPALLRSLEALEDAQIVRSTRRGVGLMVDDFQPSDVSLERDDQRRAYERVALKCYAATLNCGIVDVDSSLITSVKIIRTGVATIVTMIQRRNQTRRHRSVLLGPSRDPSMCRIGCVIAPGAKVW